MSLYYLRRVRGFPSTPKFSHPKQFSPSNVRLYASKRKPSDGEASVKSSEKSSILELDETPIFKLAKEKEYDNKTFQQHKKTSKDFQNLSEFDEYLKAPITPLEGQKPFSLDASVKEGQNKTQVAQEFKDDEIDEFMDETLGDLIPNIEEMEREITRDIKANSQHDRFIKYKKFLKKVRILQRQKIAANKAARKANEPPKPIPQESFQDGTYTPLGRNKAQIEGFGVYFPHLMAQVPKDHEYYDVIYDYGRVLSQNPSWPYPQKEKVMNTIIRQLMTPVTTDPLEEQYLALKRKMEAKQKAKQQQPSTAAKPAPAKAAAKK